MAVVGDKRDSACIGMGSKAKCSDGTIDREYNYSWGRVGEGLGSEGR